MRYRRLGKTELMVSEIGLGAEWLERHNAEECRAVIDRCGEQGINILDCWMPDPKSRNIIAVCAIALTALLFTTLFTIGSGIVENFQRQTRFTFSARSGKRSAWTSPDCCW